MRGRHKACPAYARGEAMKRSRKTLSAIGVVAVAIFVSLMLTWFASAPEDQVGILDFIGASEESSEDIRQIDWDSLPSEVVAWVEVPGTNIDEPIVQADRAYPNRWLYADVFGEGGYGTPYIDCDCSLEGPFTIVYGHHMDDGSVFADFAGYSDVGYAEDHSVIDLYTREDDQRHELKVVAVDVVNASYETLQTEFKNEKEFAEYASACLAQSDIVFERQTDVDHLYAFATCSYETWNSRTVVYAVVVRGNQR